MKICVMGGGSSYTPELMEGLLIAAKQGHLPLKEICLMDMQLERLEIIGPLCVRMAQSMGQNSLRIQWTTHQSEAVRDSSFVLLQLRVGGNAARHEDILLGHRHRIIGQETTGIGGFAKALRTIPVVENILEDIRRFAPGAWMIDFTNPVSLVTQYLSDYAQDIKWMGLCNYPYNIQRDIAAQFNVEDDSRIFLDYLGLNHLSFIRGIFLDGKDVTDKALANYLKMSKMSNLPSQDFTVKLIENLRLIPNPYLLYYYNTREVLKAKMEAKTTRAQEVAAVEEELFRLYSDPELKEKPKALEKRGGAYYSTVAVNLMKSISNNTGDMHIVNVTNHGAISDLPANASVEVPCRVDAAGPHSLNCGSLPESVASLVKSVKTYEIFAARAAKEQSYHWAYLALINHPLVTDSIVAEAALDDLLKTNHKFITGYKKT
ncbi:MAG: 6-phospho-beta-glucosidase [Spirochaetaceae bacterium]|jgi:6-phospho-beta-glucosidase|nr:6-phospho-beta-glucosidase [Spirochaetaceae bacterium]